MNIRYFFFRKYNIPKPVFHPTFLPIFPSPTNDIQQPHNGTIACYHPHLRHIPCPYLFSSAESFHHSLVGNHLHCLLINTAQPAATHRRRAARYRRYNTWRPSEINCQHHCLPQNESALAPSTAPILHPSAPRSDSAIHNDCCCRLHQKGLASGKLTILPTLHHQFCAELSGLRWL